jgi:Cu+-exporting ATPase
MYIFTLLALASINQFVFGAGFYQGAWKALKNWSANMDVLVVLGTTAAWLYGVIQIFIGYNINTSLPWMEQENRLTHAVHEHAHNFEISSTLITVILFGKFLEAFSKKQTVDKLSDLASLKVTRANLVREHGDDN